MSAEIKVSIVGASGYTGGELLRLLLGHPRVEVIQATSEHHVGEYVYSTHPQLRKRTTMQFVSRQTLQPCDVLFLALPHGEAQKEIDHYASLAGKIVDLSADFRLKDLALYKKWYGHDHEAPEWVRKFVYGLPELHRAEMRTASYISGVGCNATAANLALAPLVKNGLVDTSKPVIVEVKVGSSEAGASPNPGSHHPERAGVIRTYAPFLLSGLTFWGFIMAVVERSDANYVGSNGSVNGMWIGIVLGSLCVVGFEIVGFF